MTADNIVRYKVSSLTVIRHSLVLCFGTAELMRKSYIWPVISFNLPQLASFCSYFSCISNSDSVPR